MSTVSHPGDQIAHPLGLCTQFPSRFPIKLVATYRAHISKLEKGTYVLTVSSFGNISSRSFCEISRGDLCGNVSSRSFSETSRRDLSGNVSSRYLWKYIFEIFPERSRRIICTYSSFGNILVEIFLWNISSTSLWKYLVQIFLEISRRYLYGNISSRYFWKRQDLSGNISSRSCHARRSIAQRFCTLPIVEKIIFKSPPPR